MQLRKFPLILMVFALHLSSAVGKDFYQVERQCRKENPDVNNSIVMGCADLASDAAKASINESYKDIVRLIKKRYENNDDVANDEISRFELAQKSWLRYRENWCDSQGFLIGTPMYSICRMDENISRANALADYYEQLTQ
ncbi:lysozyme inhibitor LprI family protein [Klebsiella aerogenes]|nr:lysozyme inhibitor LprI family protein [Klebsiella aerogenes]